MGPGPGWRTRGPARLRRWQYGQTWKWALALVYGGLDLSAPTATADCSSAARAALVASWSHLFQNGCANGASSVCSAAPVNGALWHAYRRDDTSGTSDVFASILGLSPSTSNSSVNGFGASPYCNSMNWDNSTGNANCGLGAHNQFTGPGGVADPASSTTPPHRMPPPGTWGTNPNASSASSVAWDVLPTQFQDNDPISPLRASERRRTTMRAPARRSATSTRSRPGHPDGRLRLDPQGEPRQAVPTNACTTFVVGNAASVFTCANRGAGTRHPSECPNGDSLFGTGVSRSDRRRQRNVSVRLLEGDRRCAPGAEPR